MLSRRDAFRVTAATAAAAMLPGVGRAAGHVLEKLPYAVEALEPVIDAKTMEIHHGKHHKTYVDNLNAALKDHADLNAKPIVELLAGVAQAPEKLRQGIKNNGGGHWNHTFFWSIMAKPGTGGEPKGELKKAIDDSFGGLDKLKASVKDAGLKRFGSGWVWVVVGKEKPLDVVSTANQDNPIMDGQPTPVLGVDVWEHAYYLKHQNKRADYLDGWWAVANWDAIADAYAAAKKK
jgi:superoxide dismutase, Fe-Mn family